MPKHMQIYWINLEQCFYSLCRYAFIDIEEYDQIELLFKIKSYLPFTFLLYEQWFLIPFFILLFIQF